ncbi:MAG: hypothetical protein GEU92_17465 [Alphaproteobacteria bacterium]|nr:hypothetical protein [Alphaproteobacteria bacterium]
MKRELNSARFPSMCEKIVGYKSIGIDNLRKIGMNLINDNEKMTDDEVVDAISMMIAGNSKIYSKRLSKDNIWWRARKVSKDEIKEHLVDLIYPPINIVKVGRANFDKSQVLYASRSINTAVSELFPSCGDIFQLIGLAPKDDSFPGGHIVGEVSQCYRSGISSYFDKAFADEMLGHLHEDGNILNAIYCDSVMSRLFRVSDFSLYPNIYNITSLYSEIFFNIMRDHKSIMYPSVRYENGMNIAIKKETFDTYFEVKMASVVRISIDLDFGIYGFELIKESKSIDNKGKISWR